MQEKQKIDKLNWKCYALNHQYYIESHCRSFGSLELLYYRPKFYVMTLKFPFIFHYTLLSLFPSFVLCEISISNYWGFYMPI